MLLEQPSILGVEQEHEAHDEDVEAALFDRVRVDVFVLCRQALVQAADDLARLDRELFLLHQTRSTLVDQESEQVKLIRQFVQSDSGVVMLRVVGIQVVNAELVEVADDDPARTHGVWQVVGVPLRLLIRRLLAGPLRAFGLLVKVDAAALLLDEHAHVLVEHINLAATHLALEVEHVRRAADAHQVLGELYPERTRLPVLVAFFGTPSLDELLGCLPYVDICSQDDSPLRQNL